MDGSNFPCKGYHRGGNGRTTASYNVGGSYSISLAGSATHGGGSCQISLSFDNGGSFQVIKSIMGGCPLTKQYSFTIPSGVPSGKALLAWSWFNKIGNREMYMNCAPVSIGGGASEDSGEEELEKRAALPALFVANVGNGCTTIEGTEPVFANPGSSVEYGGSVTPNSPVTPRC
ncbi:hypothetical protein FQN57_003880 [Myotisia sp. PD_48]|nr:hypothetical protein FQN57_003880 [Myotisia sp. PD_48]